MNNHEFLDAPQKNVDFASSVEEEDEFGTLKIAQEMMFAILEKSISTYLSNYLRFLANSKKLSLDELTAADQLMQQILTLNETGLEEKRRITSRELRPFVSRIHSLSVKATRTVQ